MPDAGYPEVLQSKMLLFVFSWCRQQATVFSLDAGGVQESTAFQVTKSQRLLDGKKISNCNFSIAYYAYVNGKFIQTTYYGYGLSQIQDSSKLHLIRPNKS